MTGPLIRVKMVSKCKCLDHSSIPGYWLYIMRIFSLIYHRNASHHFLLDNIYQYCKENLNFYNSCKQEDCTLHLSQRELS